MSGHSHAKTIKHQKEITDQKRGKVFSKIVRLVSIAVKEGGPNPDTNSRLRMAMEMARSFNVPKENIERAIKRGSGESGEAALESVVFEAYGPEGIAIIIEGITDNKNRTLGEVKQILTQHGGKLASEGSVRWMFERKGCVVVDKNAQSPDLQNKESLELAAIEGEAKDLVWNESALNIYTDPDALEKVKKSLESKGVKVDSAFLDWVAKESVEIQNKNAAEKLFDALDENDAIQETYSNIKE